MDEVIYATEDCLADTSTWTENNPLKLDQDKTELIVFSSKQSVKKTENFHLQVGSSYKESANLVRNLDIILDNALEMKKQVNAIYKPDMLYTQYSSICFY